MSELKVIHAQIFRIGLFFDEYNASKVVVFCALQDSGSLRCSFGYTNKNSPYQALLFYQEMLTRALAPDRFTFPSLLKSCQDLREGEQLHCHSRKLGFALDAYIQNSLMYAYSQFGCLVFARKVFEKMGEKSVVSWATMIKVCK
ncbi:pentatricopeptide repeat-containing protein At1g31920-like [Carya illinoinensis]|uniref:pentatricopeptide repeat-containing protein At1g31920-like n=1 Tax=Carya illinoinensis TaxID=32201 RepID=UPI001C721654|nr:pentatricopeptide repeat-containing protein At1g31920-like [Carya illinoinensis]